MVDPDGRIDQDHRDGRVRGRASGSVERTGRFSERRQPSCALLATRASRPARTTAVFSRRPLSSVARPSRASSMFRVVRICINMPVRCIRLEDGPRVIPSVTMLKRRPVSWRGGSLLLLLIATASMALPGAQRGARDWPPITAETKPWTRWWWQGSAVERRSLSADLESLAAAGIGGVEVTPIYGVRGAEDRFIPYLSSQWMAMLDHALREATRLNMGVDMATGTGWPFGGPSVRDDTAPRSLELKTWTLAAGERLAEPVSLRQTPLLHALGNQVTSSEALRGSASGTAHRRRWSGRSRALHTTSSSRSRPTRTCKRSHWSR